MGWEMVYPYNLAKKFEQANKYTRFFWGLRDRSGDVAIQICSRQYRKEIVLEIGEPLIESKDTRGWKITT